jgi:2-iminobutanoate/2-iminopropanoate deaminase
MERKVIHTDEAPKAIGPYSQGIDAGFVFCSGQIALDPHTGLLVHGGITAQTKRVLDNLEAVLKAGGSRLDLTVKVTVYLTDLQDFEAMNKVYAEHFPQDPPARAVVQVAALPKGAAVEMDLMALKG